MCSPRSGAGRVTRVGVAEKWIGPCRARERAPGRYAPRRLSQSVIYRCVHTLTALIRKAGKLNASGIKAPRRARTGRVPLVVPDVLAAALKKNRNALATFESFSDSHKREYVEWIAEAKRDETRAKRLATAIAWMAEGKSKEWRYLRR